MLVSTRNVTAKKAEENSAESYTRPDLEALHKFPGQEAAVAKLFANGKNYPGLRAGETGLRAVVDRMKDNLRALYNDATPADRKLWAGWYEGAHKVAERAARKYGLDMASAAGVYAALSPQKQWDANVYLGDRLIDIVKTKHAEKWDDAMTRTVDGWVTSRSAEAKTEGMKANSEAQRAIAAKLIGKSYDDLDDPAEKAFWVRAYDEAHHDNSEAQRAIAAKLVGKSYDDLEDPEWIDAYHGTAHDVPKFAASALIELLSPPLRLSCNIRIARSCTGRRGKQAPPLTPASVTHFFLGNCRRPRCSALHPRNRCPPTFIDEGKRPRHGRAIP